MNIKCNLNNLSCVKVNTLNIPPGEYVRKNET